MPSQRKQLNVRLSAEAEARLARLVDRMSGLLGNAYSQSDVVATALAWLELNLPAVEAARFIPPGQAQPYKAAEPSSQKLDSGDRKAPNRRAGK